MSKIEPIKVRAESLMRQVLKTWNPPLQGTGTIADIAQTAVMQTLAFLFGPEILPNDLPENQQRAIDEGLEMMNQELLPEGR